MPERRLEKTREAYRDGLPRLTFKGIPLVWDHERTGRVTTPELKWRPSHENTAERLKQAAQRITQRYLTQCDPGDENEGSDA